MPGFSLTPVATALAGLGFLAMLTLLPQPGAMRYGLLFAPWVSRAEAFNRAAALELPIVDIRMGGRLIVLVAAPDSAKDIAVRGAFSISQRAAALCGTTLSPEEPVT